MPVKHSVMIEPISEDEFHLLDHKIMGIVFSMHKELGRFCDEKIYQNELATVTKAGTFYEGHLRRFLSHTSLKAIQWINFNHDKIEFITISK